jgi:hypothetical protein
MLVGLMRRRTSSDTRIRTLPTRGIHFMAGGRT